MCLSFGLEFSLHLSVQEFTVTRFSHGPSSAVFILFISLSAHCHPKIFVRRILFIFHSFALLGVCPFGVIFACLVQQRPLSLPRRVLSILLQRLVESRLRTCWGFIVASADFVSVVGIWFYCRTGGTRPACRVCPSANDGYLRCCICI